MICIISLRAGSSRWTRGDILSGVANPGCQRRQREDRPPTQPERVVRTKALEMSIASRQIIENGGREQPAFSSLEGMLRLGNG